MKKDARSPGVRHLREAVVLTGYEPPDGNLLLYDSPGQGLRTCRRLVCGGSFRRDALLRPRGFLRGHFTGSPFFRSISGGPAFVRGLRPRGFGQNGYGAGSNRAPRSAIGRSDRHSNTHSNSILHLSRRWGRDSIYLRNHSSTILHPGVCR